MDVANFVKIMLTALSAAVTGFLIPWLRARTSAVLRERIAGWVRVAVLAAEQLFGSGEGAQKKAFALSWLSQNGVDVTSADIDAMIESAVYEFTR